MRPSRAPEQQSPDGSMNVKGNPRAASSGPEAEGRSRGAKPGFRMFKVRVRIEDRKS